MILQPIVENAIEHGISAQCEGSTITIKADIEHDELHLLVSDSGPGFKFEHRARPSRPANGNGIGLANTRQRLDQLYGARHLIEYGPSPSGGASVAIHIPFEPAPLQVLKETA
jgi:sensor histidine kinase YesM